MNRIRNAEIHPEYSAQRRSHPPNPALIGALEFVKSARGNSVPLGRVADLGCGKLRHYSLLAPRASALFLVDTPKQLSTPHVDQGETFSILEVAACAQRQGRAVHAISDETFARGGLNLDLIVCVAVLDVVLASVRKALIRSAALNLAHDGHFIIVVPRNDSTILRRCKQTNAHADGHIFPNHGGYTFFRNFRDNAPLVRHCDDAQLALIKDLSVYRQVCMIFRNRDIHHAQKQPPVLAAISKKHVTGQVSRRADVEGPYCEHEMSKVTARSI